MIYRDGAKMSKSKGNVVSPDEIVEPPRRRRAAPLRPLHGPRGRRHRVERPRGRGAAPLHRPPVAPRRRPRAAAASSRGPSRDGARGPGASSWCARPRRPIAKVSEDIGERFSFHTAISAIQELVNLATKGVGGGPLRRRGRPGGAALRVADGGVAAVPVRARTSRRRCGRRSAASASGTSRGPRRPTRVPRARDRHRRGAGQRQAPRPRGGRRRHAGRRARRARARPAEGGAGDRRASRSSARWSSPTGW